MIKSKLSWLPRLEGRAGPIYQAIGDALAQDIRSGALAPGTRLPAQRAIAAALGIDLTTVTRGFHEARRRGLIAASSGRGTYVRAPRAAGTSLEPINMAMNLPPQPAKADLPQHLRAGLDAVIARPDFAALLGYRDSALVEEDRAAGAHWLGRRLSAVSSDRVLVAGGAQAALLAVLTTLARPGDTILTEALTYPGLRALASHFDFRLAGLPIDAEGLVPEGLEAACRQSRPKALYCVPTMHNPTTATMSAQRRQEIARIAARHELPIVEDDTYGLLARSAPPPIAQFASANTIYLASLAKVLTPALRVAYLVVPDVRWVMRLAASLRATTLMAPALMVALATRWISDGTAGRILAALRDEAIARQKLAQMYLPRAAIHAQPEAHHLWLSLPPSWPRNDFVAYTQRHGLAVVASDAFTVTGTPPEAVRLGLGAASDQDSLRRALEIIAEALEQRPEAVSLVI